jgi:hypothetical protein
MDKFTVKIMAYACKMAEITDAGISRKFPRPLMNNHLAGKYVVVTICSSYCIYLGCILLFSANNT